MSGFIQFLMPLVLWAGAFSVLGAVLNIAALQLASWNVSQMKTVEKRLRREKPHLILLWTGGLGSLLLGAGGFGLLISLIVAIPAIILLWLGFA